MVQWLKRSSETREVLCSSLNSVLFFFFFLFSLSLLYVLMFNYCLIRKVSFICYMYKMMLVFFYLQLYILLCFFFVFLFVLYLFSYFITVLGLFKFYPLSVAELSSCLNDCVTCLYQFPDPAKVSYLVGDYILSLHQHFSINQKTCVSKLHLKEIFAKTTLAASVTNALFELCSDVIKSWQNLLQGVHAGDGPPHNTLSKSSSDTFDVDDCGCFGCCCSSCAFFFSSIIF